MEQGARWGRWTLFHISCQRARLCPEEGENGSLRAGHQGRMQRSSCQLTWMGHGSGLGDPGPAPCSAANDPCQVTASLSSSVEWGWEKQTPGFLPALSLGSPLGSGAGCQVCELTGCRAGEAGQSGWRIVIQGTAVAGFPCAEASAPELPSQCPALSLEAVEHMLSALLIGALGYWEKVLLSLSCPLMLGPRSPPVPQQGVCCQCPAG